MEYIVLIDFYLYLPLFYILCYNLTMFHCIDNSRINSSDCFEKVFSLSVSTAT